MLDSLLSPQRPLIAAHRGFTAVFPENTLPAFQAALDLGADIIETDAHVSADGQAMLSHDPGLRRVAGHGGLVERYTTQQLQAIDLGGASMPTLLEALREFPSVPFSIDVKHPGAIRPVIEAVSRAEATDRVLIGSFSNRRRRQTVKGLPGVASLGAHAHTIPAYLGARMGATALVRRSLHGVNALFLPERAYGFEVFHPRFVHQVLAEGIGLGAWTINDPAQMERLWRLGVQVVITDRVDLATELRESLGRVSFGQG